MVKHQQESGALLIPAYRHIQDTQSIIRLEGRGNYTIVHLRGSQKPLMVSRTLKYFDLQLTDFIRISKSSLVNPRYVDRLIKVNAKRIFVQIADGAIIQVSRRRIADTLERLDQETVLK